jgi:hypothetical protein
MTEALLQFIWKYQLLLPQPLQLVDGTAIRVQHPGQWNVHSGPDFLAAQIYYDGLLWHGPVELHLRSSYWYAHGHHQQPSYDSVILHVVWEHDLSVTNARGRAIPCLELKSFIAPELLLKYQNNFQMNKKEFPCGQLMSSFPEVRWKQFSTRLFVSRLEEKTKRIEVLLASSKNDWEAVCFQLLARNFGLNRNGTHFEAVAKGVPFGVVRKLRSNLFHLEALFMGQSGLLATDKGAYCAQLLEEYGYLKQKFKLQEVHTLPEFLRLRPHNFPTLRWAQLARLYHESEQLFQRIVSAKQPKDLNWMTRLAVSSYWKQHFNFEPAAVAVKLERAKNLSQSFFNLLCINTFVPIRFAYQTKRGQMAAEDAIAWMENLPAESNGILKKFEQFGIRAKNALESQSMLHLYHNFCHKKHCLQCAIGVYLMQPLKS